MVYWTLLWNKVGLQFKRQSSESQVSKRGLFVSPLRRMWYQRVALGSKEATEGNQPYLRLYRFNSPQHGWKIRQSPGKELPLDWLGPMKSNCIACTEPHDLVHTVMRVYNITTIQLQMSMKIELKELPIDSLFNIKWFICISKPTFIGYNGGLANNLYSEM